MVPMRDGVQPRDRRLSARRPRARSPRCSCGCRTTRTAATAGCRSSPRTSSRAATRSCRRTCAASSAPRASRWPSSTRSPDGYDTIEWIAQQPWSNGDVGMWGDSYYGFTQWAAVAAAAPRAEGDRPARHDRRHRRLARGRDAALRRALPRRSSGPTTTRTNGRSTGATGRWPGSSTTAFAAIGRARPRSTTCSRARAAPRAAPLFPDGAPVRRAAHPDAARRGLVRQHHAAAHARLRGARARTPRRRRSSTCTPARPTTRTTSSSDVPIPESADHDTHDDALERMLPRYIGPALDFFDAFLTGRSRSGRRAARALAPAARRLAGVAELAAARRLASCASTSATPRGRPATPTGGSLAPSRASASEVDVDPRSRATPCRRRSSNPFAPLYEYPDERAVEARPDVMTFTDRGGGLPLTLAGRVVAHLAVGSDAASLFLHVKLVDVHPDGRAHALLFGQVVHDARRGRARRGLPRPHGLPRRARPSAAPARGDERFPGLPPPPRQRRESVGRDDDAHEPADARDGRRCAVVRQPDGDPRPPRCHARLELQRLDRAAHRQPRHAARPRRPTRGRRRRPRRGHGAASAARAAVTSCAAAHVVGEDARDRARRLLAAGRDDAPAERGGARAAAGARQRREAIASAARRRRRPRTPPCWCRSRLHGRRARRPCRRSRRRRGARGGSGRGCEPSGPLRCPARTRRAPGAPPVAPADDVERAVRDRGGGSGAPVGQVGDPSPGAVAEREDRAAGHAIAAVAADHIDAPVRRSPPRRGRRRAGRSGSRRQRSAPITYASTRAELSPPAT